MTFCHSSIISTQSVNLCKLQATVGKFPSRLSPALTTLSLHTHISTQWTDGCSTGCGKAGEEAAKQESMKWNLNWMWRLNRWVRRGGLALSEGNGRHKAMASNSRYDLPLSFVCKAQVIPIPVRHGNFGPEITLVVQVFDTVSFPVHVGVLIALRLATYFIASGITVTKLTLK